MYVLHSQTWESSQSMWKYSWLQKETSWPLATIHLFPPLPRPKQSLTYFVSVDSLCGHFIWMGSCVLTCDWLHSLGIMSSFIHCVACVNTFLLPKHVTSCGYTIFIYPFMSWCTLGLFPPFASRNSTAKKIGLSVLCGHLFISLEHILRSAIAGSYNKSMSSIVRKHQTFLPIGCTICHSTSSVWAFHFLSDTYYWTFGF